MRALAFTASSLSLGVSAHLLAGGAAPSPHILIFLAALVFVCAQALAGRERGFLLLALATGAVQILTHLALMSGSAAGGMSMQGPMMRLTAGMVVAHACAALGVAVLLRAAEAGLWRVRRWLARVARLALPASIVTPGAARVCTGRHGFTGQGLILAAAMLRRGPPVTA